MLYDILIIDDDFDTEPDSENQDDDFGTEPDSENQDDDFGTEPDSKTWNDNAHTLLRDLIRKNLRVTWTTGEIEDLENLSKKDLSTIQFIFLDLHLKSIEEDTKFTIINQKIISIFRKINPLIESQEVTCYINSEYFGKNYGDEGKAHLEKELKENFKEKYSLEVVDTKNALSEEQKCELIKNNLDVYCKSLIINKAIEVEKIFDEKLRLSNSKKENLSFGKKSLIFQQQKLGASEEHEKLKKRIQLLKEIRNNLAHTEENLNEIKAPEIRKTFWEIINKTDCTKDIKFLKFASLMEYIKSINKLCTDLKGM